MPPIQYDLLPSPINLYSRNSWNMVLITPFAAQRCIRAPSAKVRRQGAQLAGVLGAKEHRIYDGGIRYAHSPKMNQLLGWIIAYRLLCRFGHDLAFFACYVSYNNHLV